MSARAMAVASALHVHAFWCDLATWMKRGWILPKSHRNAVFGVLVATPCLTLGSFCANVGRCWHAIQIVLLAPHELNSIPYHSFAGCKE